MKGNKVLSLATEASRVGLQTGFEAVHNSKGLGKDHHNHKLIYGPPFPIPWAAKNAAVCNIQDG